MLTMVLNSLGNRVVLIIILAFILSNVGMFQKILFKKNLTTRDIIVLSIIFGLMGIVGTYTGIHVQGAIVNARVIGVFVGGLLGGPLVGFLSGFIAASHRYLIDIGGFTALACSISTLLEGLVAGCLKKKFDQTKYRVIFSLILGMIGEAMQMLIILLIAKPYSDALELVKIISLPMILANGIGIAIFISISEGILREIENEAAYQSQLALKIAHKTLPYFRQGYNKETALAIANIINENVDIDAVALTDTTKILAHVGNGDDHHTYGTPLQTKLTQKVIKTGLYKISNTKEEISCLNPNCQLKSAIIVPLYENNTVIGSLKLYKLKENSITKMERELALGLADLFSTQIELSNLDIQKKLLAQSELKALQAQINPHFLFNALNTIGSLTRINPDKSRELIFHLAHHFRNNLSDNFSDIPLDTEIENVKSYVAIEKARFGDKLNIIYNIPKNINCQIPPLIIQPLVENAIQHGIVNTIKGGTIIIKALDDKEKTIITVEDNGLGMDKSLIKLLLSEEKLNQDKIGIRNVNCRLKNKYGLDYGLSISSEIGLGTKVKFAIPK